MVSPRAAGVVPHLREGACTHARALDARCQACEDVCAELAIFPAGPDLILDAEACSACGACVAACPQQALTQPAAIPVIAARSATVAVALCARAPAAAGRSAAICVHALSLADLAALLGAGVERLALATGDCESCNIRPLTLIDDAAARLATLCGARGLMTLAVGAAVEADLALLPPREDSPDPARRALFAPLIDEAAPPPNPARVLVALQRAGAGAETPFAFSPRIDPATCTGCDACLRICPADALCLAAGPAYHADPARCTGCGLCMDVCEVDAITVTPMAPAAADVALSEFRCRHCQVDTHVPGPAPADSLCRICRQTGHFKKLFQVLG